MALRTKTVPTSMGDLTLSALTLNEVEKFDELAQTLVPGFQSGLRYLPLMISSLNRSPNQSFTIDGLKSSLTFEDFTLLFDTMLDISGMTKKPGEAPAPA